MLLKDKVVIVSGIGPGLGQELAYGAAREGAKIFSLSKSEIGSITSGTFGPSVNRPIAMGYVKLNFSKPGTKIFLEVRGKKHEAKISELPFYKKSYVR